MMVVVVMMTEAMAVRTVVRASCDGDGGSEGAVAAMAAREHGDEREHGEERSWRGEGVVRRESVAMRERGNERAWRRESIAT